MLPYTSLVNSAPAVIVIPSGRIIKCDVCRGPVVEGAIKSSMLNHGALREQGRCAAGVSLGLVGRSPRFLSDTNSQNNLRKNSGDSINLVFSDESPLERVETLQCPFSASPKIGGSARRRIHQSTCSLERAG